jgi:hypothetical protein
MVRNEKTRNLYFWVNLLFDVIQVFLIIQIIIKYNIKKNHTKNLWTFLYQLILIQHLDRLIPRVHHHHDLYSKKRKFSSFEDRYTHTGRLSSIS